MTNPLASNHRGRVLTQGRVGCEGRGEVRGPRLEPGAAQARVALPDVGLQAECPREVPYAGRRVVHHVRGPGPRDRSRAV